MITDEYRLLRLRHKLLQNEHNRQRNSPSRGYDEDAALEEMATLSEQMFAELDRIDALFAEKNKA